MGHPDIRSECKLVVSPTLPGVQAPSSHRARFRIYARGVKGIASLCVRICLEVDATGPDTSGVRVL